MEKVLNLLNDIEEKANSIVDHTSVEKKALYNSLTKDMKKLDEEISSKTQEKLDVIRRKMDKEIVESKKEMLTSFDRHLNKLESDYQKNHDAYVETVFQKIIRE